MAGTIVSEKAQFIQHHLPGLDAGEYAIEVQHQFAADDDEQQIPGGVDLTDPLLYKFAISGPQFSLDPTLIHTVFPPKEALGEFSNVLPHVVLSNQTLPWIRKPITEDGHTTLNTGSFPDGAKTKNYDLDIPSWLAVLILTEADLEHSTALQQTTVQNFFSNGNDVFISPVFGQNPNNQPPWVLPSANCQALKLPLDLFSKLAPSLADLFMMANVRKVEMSRKPAQAGSDVDELGTYSMVLGNRIPVSGQRHLAVLVSLENMGNYLPDHNGNPATMPAGATYALLPVLYSWHFTSQGDSYQFEHLLECLNDRAPNGVPVVPGPLPQARLRLYPPDGSTGPEPIEQGFVPLKHTTRNNVTTASWYRGPLAPFAFDANAGAALKVFQTQDGAKSPAIFDADALLRLDPTNGLFDLSYASAWQLGRLIALQDKNFSIQLYQWKRSQASAAIVNMEEELIQETFPEILANSSSADDSTQKMLLEGTLGELIKRTERFKR